VVVLTTIGVVLHDVLNYNLRGPNLNFGGPDYNYGCPDERGVAD